MGEKLSVRGVKIILATKDLDVKPRLLWRRKSEKMGGKEPWLAAAARTTLVHEWSKDGRDDASNDRER